MRAGPDAPEALQGAIKNLVAESCLWGWAWVRRLTTLAHTYRNEDLHVVSGLHAMDLNAVAEARAACHNYHADTPRTDFKLNYTSGDIVIRIPLN